MYLDAELLEGKDKRHTLEKANQNYNAKAYNNRTGDFTFTQGYYAAFFELSTEEAILCYEIQPILPFDLAIKCFEKQS